jgi:predicted RNase H-like HicB family nuclease
MKVNLKKGVNLRIEGEIGKYNTLPVEHLVKLAESLQKLIQDIARYQLEGDSAIDLNNFKLELTGFTSGSAIPSFAFTPRLQGIIGGDVYKQQDAVNGHFNNLLAIANTGDYSVLKDELPQASIRNVLVEDLYEFANTFENAPVSIVNIGKGGKIVPVYKVNRFKPAVKEKLLTTIKEKEVSKELVNEAVAKVKVIKKGGKTTYKQKATFEGKHADTGYASETIVHGQKVFILNCPLRCKLEKEDGYYIIESEMLDIVATGRSIDEAEKNFAEEFNFIYERYNQLKDKDLSTRVKRVKNFLNLLVKKIEL